MRKLCLFSLPFCCAILAACLGLPELVLIGVVFAGFGLLATCRKRLPISLVCFGLASCEEFDVLITGDANSFVESLLIKYGTLPDIEVLVAGHHGSKLSTSEHLLDSVDPEVCLISTGYNTYGHPAEETLSRLSAREIEVYRTDLMGNLTVRYKGE